MSLPASLETLSERYRYACSQIESAARRVGRPLDSARLVVVTKTHPAGALRAVIQAGARILGENYAEEAVAKMDELGPQPVEWHMIGHVQSRKADIVAARFDNIHSLDSLKLAARLSRFAAENSRTLTALLECNVSGEESKFGYPAWNASQRDTLCREIEHILPLGHLRLTGLMTMPPYAEEGEASRPYFARLRDLRDFLAVRFPQLGWKELSMGTSADYPVAVEEGATLVRIGTAIMGSRPSRFSPGGFA